MWKSNSRRNLSEHFSPTKSSAARGLSRRWTWRHLAEKVGTSKGGGINGNLPLRICPGCSVPGPYCLPDWVLVPAKTDLRAEY